MIRIAIQSKGRLNEESMALLAEADVKLSVSKRSLLSLVVAVFHLPYPKIPIIRT